MKPVTASLREKRHINSIYIDDLYLQGDDYNDCNHNVTDTVTTLISLGFCPHPDKCQLIPSQQVNILGFCINSCSMRITLTEEKREALLIFISKILKKTKIRIRELASVIGKIVASFPSVQFGPLYYRMLDKNKQSALIEAHDNYEAFTTISGEAMEELNWWLQNLPNAFAPIIIESPKLEIFTDASNEGWGASFNGKVTQGTWSIDEDDLHINVKEMLAVLFGLKSLLKDVKDVNIRLNIDNTATVSIIKHMGTSHNDDLNDIAKLIWLWAKQKQIWLYPVYIPSEDNPADEPSRNIYLDAEWKLDPEVFRLILRKLNFKPEVDLFATRLNTQLDKYVSYHPDPGAYLTDAFSFSWHHIKFYSFPPFSCISRCLQKIVADQAKGIIVVPKWPTQPFYSLLFRLLVTDPVVIPPRMSNLLMPGQPDLISEISGKTTFLACLVSSTRC